MQRRTLLTALTSFGAALFAATPRASAATTAAAASDKLKVVYHLNELDRVSFVLGNIKNHIAGVGGPDHVTIALVIHGSALRAFHSASASPEISRQVSEFGSAGVSFAACGNTLKAQNLSLEALLPGFVVADRGGVVRIAELQSQGYLYIRP
jgi:hypothetical protein